MSGCKKNQGFDFETGRCLSEASVLKVLRDLGAGKASKRSVGFRCRRGSPKELCMGWRGPIVVGGLPGGQMYVTGAGVRGRGASREQGVMVMDRRGGNSEIFTGGYDRDGRSGSLVVEDQVKGGPKLGYHLSAGRNNSGTAYGGVMQEDSDGKGVSLMAGKEGHGAGMAVHLYDKCDPDKKNRDRFFSPVTGRCVLLETLMRSMAKKGAGMTKKGLMAAGGMKRDRKGKITVGGTVNKKNAAKVARMVSEQVQKL